MTPEQRLCLMELCEKIQTETDQKKFAQLIYDLNVLIEEVQNTMSGKNHATQS